jgi:hypothetical protein
MKTTMKLKKATAKPIKTSKKTSPKPLAAAKRATAKRAAKKPAARAMVARRADFGAPVDGFFAKQRPPLRAILEALRELVEEAAPDATASLKWGMPMYTIGTVMMCGLAGHKSHVNLLLAGPPQAFIDPDGRLEGNGKTGRHLALRSIDDLPRKAVRAWLRIATKAARAKA